LIASLALALTAYSQTKPAEPRVPPPVAVEKVPVISDRLQRDYYRAEGTVQRLSAEWKKGQSDLAAAVAALEGACGKNHRPQPREDDLVCVAIPAPPPPPQAKPTPPAKSESTKP